MRYSVKEDSAVIYVHTNWMWYEWTINPYLDRHTAYKLEEHSQQGLVKDGNHLGGSRSGSSKQIRIASACGPMHPLGCGLNHGQGQSTVRMVSTWFKINVVCPSLMNCTYVVLFVQNEMALCRRFTVFVTKYNLMSKDNLIVPNMDDQLEVNESEAWLF